MKGRKGNNVSLYQTLYNTKLCVQENHVFDYNKIKLQFFFTKHTTLVGLVARLAIFPFKLR